MKNIFFNTQEDRFDAVVFQNRNKNYGAFALRNESDQLLSKALFSGIGLLAVLSIGTIIYTNYQKEQHSEIVDVFFPTMNMKEVVLPDDEVVQPKSVAPPVEKVQQYNSQVVEPTNNAVESIKMVVPKTAKAGFQNDFTAPVAPTHHVVILPPTLPVSGTHPVTPTPADPNPNEVVTKVDKEADFIGGIDAFREKVVDRFDTSRIEGSDSVKKSIVTFIVEKNGTITSIKAEGSDKEFNEEAIRSIKKIKGTWTPAQVKGNAVRSFFRFPISMNFE